MIHKEQNQIIKTTTARSRGRPSKTNKQIEGIVIHKIEDNIFKLNEKDKDLLEKDLYQMMLDAPNNLIDKLTKLSEKYCTSYREVYTIFSKKYSF